MNFVNNINNFFIFILNHFCCINNLEYNKNQESNKSLLLKNEYKYCIPCKVNKY